MLRTCSKGTWRSGLERTPVQSFEVSVIIIRIRRGKSAGLHRTTTRPRDLSFDSTRSEVGSGSAVSTRTTPPSSFDGVILVVVLESLMIFHRCLPAPRRPPGPSQAAVRRRHGRGEMAQSEWTRVVSAREAERTPARSAQWEALLRAPHRGGFGAERVMEGRTFVRHGDDRKAVVAEHNGEFYVSRLRMVVNKASWQGECRTGCDGSEVTGIT